jgi:hypothetical protein
MKHEKNFSFRNMNINLELRIDCRSYARILFLYLRIPCTPFMWKICCLKIKINPLSSVTSSQSSSKMNVNACGKQRKYGLNTAYRLFTACRATCQRLRTFVVRRALRNCELMYGLPEWIRILFNFQLVCVLLDRMLVRILTVKQCISLTHA